MSFSSPPFPTSPAAVSSSQSEEREGEPEMIHKIKVIQFLGRTSPIILQNDNGPCPLLAICNVLLLKNNLTLSPYIPEVSQQKLLSLVADRIIKSNSNVDDKEAGYVENQQQNIADAIDLLPRLTTGIDVNVKFRRIGDFEFTRECAIFDLLDIPLYHGWIVDPQDCETANAIGSKSYNTLTGNLVALESQNLETENKKTSEDDSVDFVAATTAALGVPSPCLSRGRSFDDSPVSLPNHQNARKGDIEEEAELFKVMKLSECEVKTFPADKARKGDIEEEAELFKVMKLSESEVKTFPADYSFPVQPISSADMDGNLHIKNSDSISLGKEPKSIAFDESQKPCLDTVTISDSCVTLKNHNFVPVGLETVLQEAVCSSTKTNQGSPCNESVLKESEINIPSNVLEHDDVKTHIDMGSVPPMSSHSDSLHVTENVHISGEHGENEKLCDSTSETFDSLNLSTHPPDTDSVNVRGPHVHEPEGFTSSVDACEPIYEGEENILELKSTSHQDREPVYEGEVLLAELGDRSVEVSDTKKPEITPREDEFIRIFLKNSASQLTIYGLFCLQEGLKERELCVFFRNNHFSTMFKFEGELYILVTDLGYLNQHDLVWEKLNEVNGDTVYMTGNFKEFKVENQGNASWDEQNAMTSTADYLASIDNSTQEDPSFDSDLQLAIALQQREFEQQASQRQNNARPPSVGGGRLVTGPQVSKNSGRYAANSSKQEPKSSRDKCIVM